MFTILLSVVFFHKIKDFPQGIRRNGIVYLSTLSVYMYMCTGLLELEVQFVGIGKFAEVGGGSPFACQGGGSFFLVYVREEVPPIQACIL